MKRHSKTSVPPVRTTAAQVLAWLKETGTEETRLGMTRYGIPNDRAFGVPVGQMRAHARSIGADHDLAIALWETGWYEARMMASFVGDPHRVTRSEMDAWAADFDNWAICDTVCFHLYDRVPFAWEMAWEWIESPDEFVKRAGFVLMAVLPAPAGDTGDSTFLACLQAIERCATDERNFVKKGVNWALRAIGRHSIPLNQAATEVAQRLARSENSAARWIGKDAARELTSTKVLSRLK